MGGTIWSKAQPGPVINYAKNVLKNTQDESLVNKINKVNFCVILIIFFNSSPLTSCNFSAQQSANKTASIKR